MGWSGKKGGNRCCRNAKQMWSNALCLMRRQLSVKRKKKRVIVSSYDEKALDIIKKNIKLTGQAKVIQGEEIYAAFIYANITFWREMTKLPDSQCRNNMIII